MEGKQQNNGVSRYFKQDSSSIFDELPTTQLEKLPGQGEDAGGQTCDSSITNDIVGSKQEIIACASPAIPIDAFNNIQSSSIYTLESIVNKEDQSYEKELAEDGTAITREEVNTNVPKKLTENTSSTAEAKLSTYFSQASTPFNFIGKPHLISEEDLNLNESNLVTASQPLFHLSSDVDRSHDAWIPCKSTKEELLALSSLPTGTHVPNKDLLTLPGIAIKEEFGDPVKNLLQTYVGEEISLQRNTMTASSVTQDDRGLRQLIDKGYYHAAVNLTTQLLTVYGQGEGRAGQPSKHTAHSIQLWFTRIALLVKLRRFSLAEVECESLGDLDSPDLYFEFYPELYGGRKGSMVPFSFRLLVAVLPQYLGKHTQALDRMSKLLGTCNQILKNLNSGLNEDGSGSFAKDSKEDIIKVWKLRRVKILYCLCNCAVGLKDFRLASALIQNLLREDPELSSGLFSALGRLCLLLGDISSAQEAFKRHLEHSPTGVHYDPVQGLLHSAFISCAQNNFQDATQILHQAHKISPQNALVINNLGVSMMYVGKIREAIQMVENALFANPEKLLHEALLLNLSTMYELESSNSHKKKLHLLSLVANHKGDGFNIAALKLQVS